MEQDKAEIAKAHEQLQRIILELLDDKLSDNPLGVRSQLVLRIAAAGLNPQPPKWLDDTSVDIAAGRLVLIDAHLGREAEKLPDSGAGDAKRGDSGDGPDNDPED